MKGGAGSPVVWGATGAMGAGFVGVAFAVEVAVRVAELATVARSWPRSRPRRVVVSVLVVAEAAEGDDGALAVEAGEATSEPWRIAVRLTTNMMMKIVMMSITKSVDAHDGFGQAPPSEQ